jgi:hypothetical protein
MRSFFHETYFAVLPTGGISCDLGVEHALLLIVVRATQWQLRVRVLGDTLADRQHSTALQKTTVWSDDNVFDCEK